MKLRSTRNCPFTYPRDNPHTAITHKRTIMQPDTNLTGNQQTLPSGAPVGDDADFEVKSIIDSTIKPLIAIDNQGTILDITPVAAMLLKGLVNKFKGSNISAVFPELQGDLNNVAAVGLSTSARRSDGSAMPVRLTMMRVITDYLDGWMIFVQVRKAPAGQDNLSHLGLGNPFNVA
jgi:hypothetical protein